MNLGATDLGDGCCCFLVWAPLAQKVEVHLLDPQERLVPMNGKQRGYHQAILGDVGPASLYQYRLDGKKERPDPASRFQPQGVHGPSQVVDPDFAWEDRCWFGLPLSDYVIYELHVGAFSRDGTFEAIIPYLEELKELGITAIELMPVAQFPGSRNWGYDGVYPFAVQNSYGRPQELKTLVNACHQQGLAVVLDVVYNHLGPEGNYLGDFGPYFNDRYRTLWGPAINYDGPQSDEVRHFFIENALYWVTEFHIDALRLDAVHAIVDHTARPFLQELAEAVHQRAEQLNRRIYAIAESTLNDQRLIQPPELGGYDLDAQWNDDFHHALHTLLTAERSGYYRDFGGLKDLVKAFTEGYVYSGQYSAFRQCRHGASSHQVPASKFVVCAQNHDQVGNRVGSERLSQQVSFEDLKLAAGVVILSPFIPLLFMGEEYGETAPFQYFVNHSDEGLIEAVNRGRRQEFTAFQWQGDLPYPQDESTFLRSKLNHQLRQGGHHRVLLEFHRELLRLRREVPALASRSKEQMEVLGYEREKILCIRRWEVDSQVWTAFNFGASAISVTLPLPAGRWYRRLDSAGERWLGENGSVPCLLESEGEVSLDLRPKAFVLLMREEA